MRMLQRRGLLLWWVLLPLVALGAGGDKHVLAPGYGPLQFEPPAPGTYALPPMGRAADGEVLSDTGEELTLHGLMQDKLVLLGFIYTHCPDVNGCPLASYVMGKVQDRLLQNPALAQQVRLISLSFDPANDTPAALRDYARHFRRQGVDWRFLTTASEADLAPILEGYDQWRQKNVDAEGNYVGTMSHILRVFLIDRQGRIRNIYSTGFLNAPTVYNDLVTLQMEESPRN